MTKVMTKLFGARRVRLASYFLACVAVTGALVYSIAAGAGTGGPRVFKLRQVSVLDQPNEAFLRGQRVKCQEQPFAEVKAYPVFVSQAPIYGAIRFGEKFGETNSGVLFHFAIDESGGTGKGYDRLYLDQNRDLDLSNDAVTKRQTHPSERAKLGMNMSKTREQVIFESLKVDVRGDSAGGKGVEIMPRLTLAGDDTKVYKWMSFIRSHVYQGRISVGGESFEAALGDDFAINGALDAPFTALLLGPKGRPGNQAFDWWGGDRLAAAHKIGGHFFTFSANPTGDELTVRPYAGELGTFAIGPGKRALSELAVTGSFEAEERTVPVGGVIEDGRPKATASCAIPVGDYLPAFLHIRFGRLQIDVSENYHSEGKRMDRAGRPRVHGISIRKDKPFVLDFSNKPDVMFTSPTNSQRLKLGDTLQVSAILVDPQLDVMIRRLDDTTRKQSKAADGKPLGYERNFSLDPKVIITRLNGEKVAEGVMPFG